MFRCNAMAIGLVMVAGVCFAEGKGTEVNLDGFKSMAPAKWQAEEAKGMRMAQFKLPRVGDDKADASVVIFKGIAGTDEQNIDRWKGMFKPPKDKKIDDVAKVKTIKVGDADVTVLEIHGTYSETVRPMDPASKVDRPDYRMVAVIFRPKKEVFHIRLVGPDKTVESYKQGFEDWIKAFKSS